MKQFTRFLSPSQQPAVALGGIGIGLILLHLILLWKLTAQLDQLGLNLLFWGAIGLRLWQQRSSLSLNSDWSSSAIGLLLLAFLLIKSVSLFWVETTFLRLLPGLAAVSLGLLASGWRLQQFWREFLLLLPLMLPKSLLLQGLETEIGLPMQAMTAQFSAFTLHYLGFTVERQGNNIILPQGAVEVMFGCTGIPALILLLQLALLFIVFHPLTGKQRVQVCLAAITIAFTLSSLRIALLALIVSDHERFFYWHDAQGAQLFSAGAIVLFAWFCHSLAERTHALSHRSPDPKA